MSAPLVWTEIDLSAIAHNVRELRRLTNPEARLMAAVKANAYGHGITGVAREVLRCGADELGVARIEEGIALREAGIDVPVLIFGHTPSELNEKLFQFDLRPTVFSIPAAEAISKTAVTLNDTIKIHLKIDTGMGRLGMLSEIDAREKAPAVLNGIIQITKLPGIEIQGIYTHFATADSSDKTYANMQFKRFTEFLSHLDQKGIAIPLRHAANSAAIIDMPETHLNMVRAGISLYGLYPSDEVDKSRVTLQPAMEIKTRIIHLKKVPAGFKISYGSTYETVKDTVIATLPVGYGDGYNRLLSSQGHVLVRGRRAPVVGRVCMDLTMIDVGHIPDASLDDEVVLLGRQKDAFISADEIASLLNTINYEVVTSVAERVPRIYLS